MAYRFNDFAYLTDLSEIPPETIDSLRDLGRAGARLPAFPASIRRISGSIKRSRTLRQLKPRRTFFTHIAHDIKHERDSARLPAGVEFAYDGLVVEHAGL